MGGYLSREFVNFTNTRICQCKRYYLSEIMCEWVWGAEGHDIYKWAKDKELGDTEDYRSVIDMIRLCKRIRKHRGGSIFTKQEWERYLLFIQYRRLKKIGSHTIHITKDKYEYIEQ